MAQVWNAALTDSIDADVLIDQTTGLVTPVVSHPIGATIGLDLLSTAQRTSGSVNRKVFIVSNTVPCHMKFGDNTVVADVTCQLLMPGERMFVLPNQYVSVVKSTGAADGIIRFTECA